MNVKVDSFAPGGRGVAHVTWENEKRAVFVRRGVPGDVLDVDVDFSTRPARAEIARIELPSEHRVEPPCPYQTECGGCDLMHVTAKMQSAARFAFVTDALRGLSAHASTPHREEPSATVGTRTRARLHVESDKRGKIAVGFYADESHDIVEVDRCIALAPELDAARAKLATLIEGAKGRGEALLALGSNSSASTSTRGVVLSLTWTGELPPAFFARCEAAVNSGTFVGIRISEKGSARPATIGDPTPFTLGADGAPIALAPGGFAQATESPELAAVVVSLATRALRGKESPRVVELFAGAGNFTVALAPLAAKGSFVAVESNADASDRARANLSARGIDSKSAKVTCADAASFPENPRADLVVLDPPREGARGVCERLAREKPRCVLYVSCDPQTLARDARILDASYTIADVHTVECFPNTSHVETVVLFERRK
jgi:23S rRNA (uracil1939-C5)-methyltransferase